MFGGILFGWIIGPLWFYTRAFDTPVLESSQAWGQFNASTLSMIIPVAKYANSTVGLDPIPVYNSNSLFDSKGYGLRVSQGTYPNLLDKNNNLNMTTYERAGNRIYLAPAFALNYFCSFISLGAVFSQVFLWYGKDLYKQFSEALQQKDSDLYEKDVHARLIKAYGDISDRAYLIYFLVLVTCSVLVCHYTPFQMEWWLTLLCIFVGFVFTLPVGIIYAITGYMPGLNILTQVISGLIVPGETTSVMAFKTMGYDISIQSLGLSLDLKLGQYMHISPISLVFAQLIGTVLGSFTMTTFAFVVMDAQGHGDWVSPWAYNGYRTFGNAGGIWGAIGNLIQGYCCLICRLTKPFYSHLGPARFFGTASPYFFLNYGYVIGFLAPFIPWGLNKVYPHPNWRKINVVLISAAYITMNTGNPQVSISTHHIAMYMSFTYTQ
jgi:OPT family oligopeptide transporter